jgi:hypothetical protein
MGIVDGMGKSSARFARARGFRGGSRTWLGQWKTKSKTILEMLKHEKFTRQQEG